MTEKMNAFAIVSWEAVVRRVASVAFHRLQVLVRALRHRSEVMRLTDLDDRALKDIGLTRVEVLGALAEPFHKDPSAILLVRSVERRSRLRPVAVTPESLSRRERDRGEGFALTQEGSFSTRVAV